MGLCVNCGTKEISKHGTKFCSSKCSAIYNNKVIDRYCLFCNKKIELTDKNKKYYFKRKYCNGSCQGAYKNKVSIKIWQENPKKYNNQSKVPDSVKSYLLEQADYKCQECGWNKVNAHTGKIPLEVHHIDGQWWINQPENLIILCPNCHALTENYKAANVGKSKHKTNKRGRGYKNGRHDVKETIKAP